MGWVSVTIPGFFLLYILRPHARCELEIRYENGRLWLEKTAVETVLKRQ